MAAYVEAGYRASQASAGAFWASFLTPAILTMFLDRNEVAADGYFVDHAANHLFILDVRRTDS